MIDDLTQKFPLTEPQIIGEQNQKDFIVLFGALLRMRNLLSSFDDFKGNELISERDLQDYLGRYQDLRDEWRNKKHDETKEDITDDVVFEVELIRQVEINIDYILMLVKSTMTPIAMTKRCSSRFARRLMPARNCAAKAAD